MDTTLSRNYFVIRTGDHVAHSITTSLEEAKSTVKTLMEHFIDETSWEVVQITKYPERRILKHWITEPDGTLVEQVNSALIGAQLLS